MSIQDIVGPVRRNWIVWGVLVVLFAGLGAAAIKPFLTYEQTTIYFTVVPQGETPAGNHYYSTEGSERLAEAMSGWAKDPAFREKVIVRAREISKDNTISVAYFKRKLAARKQNRMNVFFTVRLNEDEKQWAGPIADGLVDVIQDSLAATNAETPFPFTITPPRRFGEYTTIPWSWLLVGMGLLGAFLATLLLYARDITRGRISFLSQVKQLFPTAPVLRVLRKPGDHDETQLEQFILTFSSPRLLSTFSGAEAFFNLAPQETIDESHDTPILLVKLGKTALHDLENLRAIFGDKVGLIVFER